VIRVAVVGAGIMGANHVRIAATSRDAELAFVVDPDLHRAERAALASGASATIDIRDLFGKVDAAIVATPSSTHADLAIPLIEAGIDVLVEKPIATDEVSAGRIVEAADRRGAVLMVGHVERFNPSVLELDRICNDIVHIDASRLSPYSSRILDDVVTDLMIHDLDIVRSLVGSPIVDVSATTRVVRSPSADLACALLTFENGITANITASRIGQQKVRELRITQADSFVNVDLVRMDVTINRVEHSEFLSDSGARYRQTGVIEIPFLENRGEPLALEQAEFFRAVATRTRPRVTGEDGLEAIRLVHRVLAAAGGDHS
jgi:predicted dehydrogenase